MKNIEKLNLEPNSKPDKRSKESMAEKVQRLTEEAKRSSKKAVRIGAFGIGIFAASHSSAEAKPLEKPLDFETTKIVDTNKNNMVAPELVLSENSQQTSTSLDSSGVNKNREAKIADIEARRKAEKETNDNSGHKLNTKEPIKLDLEKEGHDKGLFGGIFGKGFVKKIRKAATNFAENKEALKQRGLSFKKGGASYEISDSTDASINKKGLSVSREDQIGKASTKMELGVDKKGNAKASFKGEVKF